MHSSFVAFINELYLLHNYAFRRNKMSSAAGQVAMLAHGKRVRILYKTILKLHRGLPAELAYMGDAYVKDEFKRHKKASPEQTVAFMEAWAVSDEIYTLLIV